MYAYRVRSYIGAYAASMGGVDAITFTAGIGENVAGLREKICQGLEYLGVEFDKEVNSVRKSGIVELSKDNSKVKVFKVPTNEELVIARDTYELIK
jgi:acetate kinase